MAAVVDSRVRIGVLLLFPPLARCWRGPQIRPPFEGVGGTDLVDQLANGEDLPRRADEELVARRPFGI
jgi:hypothetical protein